MSSLVLVTGGAGFIGSHTIDLLLANGYRVRVLDRLDPQVHGPDADPVRLVDPRAEFVLGDVRDDRVLGDALSGASLVLHLAALTGVGQSMYDMGDYCDVNVTGTARLVERIVKDKLPVRRLVLSSSRAVYGEGTHRCDACGEVHPGARSIDDLRDGHFGVRCPRCGGDALSALTAEDRPLLPLSTYGWTKRCQEDLVLSAAATFGLDVAVLRYFNVYGSRQSLVNPYTGIVSIFYARLQAGRSIPLYEAGTPRRDFVHVSDVAEANLRALAAAEGAGTVCNIGSGQAVTVADVARAIGRALGREPQFESSGEFRVGDIHACVADVGRAHRDLSFVPSTSLVDGIAEFVAWAAGQRSIDQSTEAATELDRHGLLGRRRLR